MKAITLVVLGLMTNQLYSHSNEKLPKPNYLSIQTGGIVDGYNSVGIRTFFEYQKDLKKNWQYGISYEHSRHYMRAATDFPNDLETNLSLLSLNGYYKLNLWKDKVFWTSGIGAGAVHADWKDNDRIGAAVNASLTLNIKVTKRIYIETSSLLILFPFNRVYYSTMNVESHKNFHAFTVLPIGLKIKL